MTLFRYKNGTRTKIASFLSKPIQNTSKSLYQEKNAVLTIFKNPFFVPEIIKCFKICKLAKRWRHLLNQILIEYDEKRCISQVISELFDSMQ